MDEKNQLPVYNIDGKKLRLRRYDTLTLEDENNLISENGENLELKNDPAEFLKTVLIPLNPDDEINFNKASYELLSEVTVDFMIEKNRFLSSMGERLESLLKQKQKPLLIS